MPTTIGSLIIFTVFLTPGFLYYIKRRQLIPQQTLSPLVELATFVSISVGINLLTLGIFCVVRLIAPNHTPNIELLFVQGSTYLNPRLGYVAIWACLLLLMSCTFAVIAGRYATSFKWFLTSIIVQDSAWYFTFDKTDELIYLGCVLVDGQYVGGYLNWYNTDVVDSADRDLVLDSPITLKRDGVELEPEIDRVILSSRNIIRMDVSYIKKESDTTSPTVSIDLSNTP